MRNQGNWGDWLNYYQECLLHYSFHISLYILYFVCISVLNSKSMLLLCRTSFHLRLLKYHLRISNNSIYILFARTEYFQSQYTLKILKKIYRKMYLY